MPVSCVFGGYRERQSALTTAARTTTTMTFFDQANAVCKPYLDYNTSHPFPYDSIQFDPRKPNVGELPRVGEFFDLNPMNHTLTSSPKALGEPPSHMSGLHTFLDDLDRSTALTPQQIAAARASDAAGFVATLDPIQASIVRLQQDLAPAGFQSLGVCSALFY